MASVLGHTTGSARVSARRLPTHGGQQLNGSMNGSFRTGRSCGTDWHPVRSVALRAEGRNGASKRHLVRLWSRQRVSYQNQTFNTGILRGDFIDDEVAFNRTVEAVDQFQLLEIGRRLATWFVR